MLVPYPFLSVKLSLFLGPAFIFTGALCIRSRRVFQTVLGDCENTAHGLLLVIGQAALSFSVSSRAATPMSQLGLLWRSPSVKLCLPGGDRVAEGEGPGLP